MTSTLEFIKKDFGSTLFPLKTNLILAEVIGNEIKDYIDSKVLSDQHEGDNFLSQHKVYATKPKGHLRRTVKLDPVSEYFIYDLVYRNRKIFRPQVSDKRRSYGYRFHEGNHIPVHISYSEYKLHLVEGAGEFSHNIQFDIASYFNSLYHHDLSHWFASKSGVTGVDSNALGKFFRETNSGRSVDFLPHGIYPCKMIGNEFLKFVDLSGLLKSSRIVRFMDDFTLFDNDPNVLKQDFIRIQQLLGKFALNVNPSKTYYDNKVGNIEATLTSIKQSLKEIITDYEEFPTASGVAVIETEVEIENGLSQEQIDGLMILLRDDELEESDADLILTFLRSHSDRLLEVFPILLEKFPNIIKHMYSLSSEIADKASLTKIIHAFLHSDIVLLEYQLFWLGATLEDFLCGTDLYGECLIKIYELTSEFKIARAKILEIPDQGFGLKEIRDELLRTGQSDWLSWSSAIGSRSLPAGERNYVLDYFSKGSPMNFLVASGVKKL
ncbi:MAG TPA: antiviral reverse transcriptase Drt5 [Cellvibrionaceae bacterium]